MTATAVETRRLATTVHGSFAGAAVLAPEWDALAASLGSPVQASYGHCAAWWSRYGTGRELHVLEFRDGGELVGVLPFFTERVRLGPVALRVAGIVGSDSTPVVLDLPVRESSSFEALSASLSHLLGEGRCDVVKLGPLSGESVHAASIHRAAREAGAFVGDDALGPHTVFDLPPTFDEYLRSLDKKQRGNHRRAMKTLAEEHGVVCDVVSDPAACEAEFPRFRDLHEAQWRAEGKLGHFRDWPLAEEFHADVLRLHAKAGRAHIVRLAVGGEVVSSQLCWSFGPTLHWVLPARAVREDLARHSLGRLGLVQLIEFAIGAGFRRIEGGIGRYDYKTQLGATEHTARSIVVARNEARTRLALFRRLAKLLDAVYYRGWFKRIAPRLGVPKGPLRNTWIRSRL